MSITLKRRLTYTSIILFNLCTGLGYAIIFPTIWNYIHEKLHGNSSMLGLVIASYSFSSFFANPVVGWWSDKSLNTRNILLVTILAEVIGSILYFVGINTWILVLGRLIAGVGAGGGAAVLADITRTTSEEERTSTLSTVIASRQLGLIIGPSFNVFLCQANFDLFSLPVDKYSSPGLLMAFLWLLLEFIVFFGYFNLTSLKNEEDVERLFENYNSAVTGTIPYGDLDASSSLEVAITSSYPPYVGSAPTTDIVPPGTLAYSSSHPNLQIEWLNDNTEHFSIMKREEIESINCQNIYFNSQLYENKKRFKKSQPRVRSVSDRMIESAERLMQSTSGSYPNYYDNTDMQDEESTNNPTSTNPSTPYDCSRPTSLPDEKTSLLGRMRQDASSSLEVAITSSYPPYVGSAPTTDIVPPGTLAYSSSHPNLQIEWLNDNTEHFSIMKREEIESINCQNIYFNSQLYENKKRFKKSQPRVRSVSDRMIESAERLMQSTSGSYPNYYDNTDMQDEESTNNPTSTNPSTPYDCSRPTSLPDEKTSLLGRMRQDYFRDEIIVLLGLSFISCFAQTVLETVVTPLDEKYYNFTETYNSYIFLVAGIEVIIVFGALKYVSKLLSDRCLIIFGLITLIIAMILPLFFIPYSVPGETKTLYLFMITVVIDLIGIAVIVVCSSSLLSKLTSEDSQATFQGLRRSMASLGCIMGPLWGGAFLFNTYCLFAVPLAVTVLILVLFLASYKKLNPERSEL